MKIKISRVEHREQSYLKLEFDYDTELIELVKKLPNRRWSMTLHAWLIPDTKEALAHVNSFAVKHELLFDNIAQPPEAEVKLESYSNKEIEIDVIDRKIRIKMPRNEADIDFVKAIRFSRWNNAERRWEVPDYPGNLDQLKDYFGKRIHRITQHDIELGSTAAASKKIIGSKDVLMMRMRSGRLRIIAPYNKALMNKIKDIPYNRWDNKNKWWTIPYSDIFVKELTAICENEGYNIIADEEKIGIEEKQKRISRYDIANYRDVPESYRQKLIELRYSNNTVKHYISAFEEFINYYQRFEIEAISEPQIKEYIRYLITERKISESYQNTAINAIKFYYEKVCKGQRKFYFLDRPKREKTLPEVLNTEEIRHLIKSTHNIKHKLIIMFGYSSGLRLNEINRIRLSDIDRERMQLRVNEGKGKKDRYTKLSAKILVFLDQYLDEYNPSDLIFTGSNGKSYSDRSIQNVVKAAVKRVGITKSVSTRTLRHSFATHLLENGTDLRYIQELMGHASSKTTEIYTHITTKGFDKIKSPMDDLDI